MNDFIKNMEQYYGINYSPLEKNLLQSYLKGKGDIDYKRLIGEVLKKHSKTFRSLPDIAIIDKCLPGVNLEIEAAEKFRMIVNKASWTSNLMTTNKRIYAGIIRCGGYRAIYTCNQENEKWLLKDFISGYCSDVSMIEPKLLRGDGDRRHTIKIECDDMIDYVNESQKNELKNQLDYVMEGIGK